MAKPKVKVEFDAHRVMNKPTEVEFTTKRGELVDFTAKKPVKVAVHVLFKASRKK